jgi:hypothetical protein
VPFAEQSRNKCANGRSSARSEIGRRRDRTSNANRIMIGELEKRSEKIPVDLKSKMPTPNAREEADCINDSGMSRI